MRPEDESYFEEIDAALEDALAVADRARERGGDPAPEVEIPVAADMAARVEKILGIDGVAERVRELEADYSREEAALELAADFAAGRVGDYDTPAGKVEGAVRTAVALLTEGVVAAPIEGIDRVEVLENDDGSAFVDVYYAGPIRSAGGTAQALSVLVADYTRALVGLDAYRARSEEVERYAEEVALYDDDTGLQYSPSEAETKFVAEHLPVMLDGEATGDQEVSGFRDLERVDTNNPRGGMCLVLAEGIALKAPKIQRYTRELDEISWPWLQTLIDGDYADDAAEGGESADDTEAAPAPADDADEAQAADDGPPRTPTSKKYLRDLIAGRPVFGHPGSEGGFRLRYGRARNHGFATAGVHPATMHVVDDFLATGTQLKTELPGKAAGVVPVDSLEGPTVRLANGDVRRLDDPAEALAVRNGIEAVLDLGEYLVGYGEFVENNRTLAPAAYAPEWWVQDLAAAGADVQALRDSPHVDLDDPTPDQALAWVTDFDAPLHPAFTYLWHDVTVEQFETLTGAVADGELTVADGAGVGAAGSDAATADPADCALVLEATDAVCETLETLLVEHSQGEAITVPEWRPLVRQLGVTTDLEREWDALPESAREWPNAMRAVEAVAPFPVRERAPTRVGCRMGRPEKSEERELSPAVHTLFPIGEAGGAQRDVSAASTHAEGMQDTPGEVAVDLGERRCADCGTDTFWGRCPDCGARTTPRYECDDCGRACEPDATGRAECPRCERTVSAVGERTVDLRAAYRDALDAVGERESAFEILKGVKGLTSAEKVPEPLEKGVLRAKHGVSAFKDGTVRYDMTDLPVTAVRPRELGVGADRLRALGYDEDVHGDPLRHDDQLVHLKVQDVVLSEDAADHLLDTADFVDDLLASYYGLEPYYAVEEREDLVGELVFGMAPHTSAAVVGRVVGFTSAAVGYAHPYFHAAKRRNCFHPETKVWYEDEAGEWHYEAIRSLVESRLDDPREDDFGTLVQELDGEVRVPSLDEEGRLQHQPVEAVSKHPAPDHLVQVETRSGRELTVTPDHEVHVLEDGSLVDRRASALSTSDGLVVPTLDHTDVSVGSTAPSRGGVASDGGGYHVDPVETVDYSAADVDHTYCLTVADTHSLVANDLSVKQCDGDEDCVMLLMDGLLNFSKAYLPDNRGGRMDAPLVMSSRIDPTEIDDEAHNVDTVERYPREFYEATRELVDPGEVEVELAESTLGTDDAYAGFDFTHDTSDIALGPALSAYKTLGSMEEKMDAQLELARKLRAVDETDVAERVIEYHFLPDLIGNLRAFSSQETRCLDCGTKYRRVPLSGDCRRCGGDVSLTVHEGSVSKYMDTALRVAEEYGAREYTKQRLDILRRSLERTFENDKNKQSGIADFM